MNVLICGEKKFPSAVAAKHIKEDYGLCTIIFIKKDEFIINLKKELKNYKFKQYNVKPTLARNIKSVFFDTNQKRIKNNLLPKHAAGFIHYEKTMSNYIQNILDTSRSSKWVESTTIICDDF